MAFIFIQSVFLGAVQPFFCRTSIANIINQRHLPSLLLSLIFFEFLQRCLICKAIRTCDSAHYIIACMRMFCCLTFFINNTCFAIQFAIQRIKTTCCFGQIRTNHMRQRHSCIFITHNPYLYTFYKSMPGATRAHQSKNYSATVSAASSAGASAAAFAAASAAAFSSAIFANFSALSLIFISVFSDCKCFFV